MMDGRVKTLHPKIHGAFLALRDNENHIASMNEHGIEPIDLVVVNLYPFRKTIAKEDVSLEEAVENIDIGGPAMIRSASKNWRDVAVVTDAKLYEDDFVKGKLRKTRRRLDSRNTRDGLQLALYARRQATIWRFRISCIQLNLLARSDNYRIRRFVAETRRNCDDLIRI